MTLQEFFKTTYRPLRLRGRSPKTVVLYECLFRSFNRWLAAEGIAAEAGIEHLDELVLARYLEHRAASVSPYTAEKERCQLMALAEMIHRLQVRISGRTDLGPIRTVRPVRHQIDAEFALRRLDRRVSS